MKDYEMYDNDIKVGITNIYWDNINNKYNNSIIKSIKNATYKIVSISDKVQYYELEFIIDNRDDLYDIVSKYILDDNEKFVEIDRIKNNNNIKRIRKNQLIKIIILEKYLKCFDITKKDIDLNSLINAKIYFINKVCENNKNLDNLKVKLEQVINNFKNIINSKEYTFYLDNEKNKIKNRALDMLNDLVLIVENKTSYRFGKDFAVPLKVKMQ